SPPSAWATRACTARCSPPSAPTCWTRPSCATSCSPPRTPPSPPWKASAPPATDPGDYRRMTRALLLPLLLAPLLAQAQPPFGGPPPEAKQACQGRAEGSACGFDAPHGRIEGSCRQVPEGHLCVPEHGMRPQGGPTPTGRPQAGMPQMEMPQGGRPMDRQGRPPRVDIAATAAGAIPTGSRIPDTNQGSCFDADGIIPCPAPGQPWYGQDAQYASATPSYRDNGDGTLSDAVTGLMWQQGHNEERINWYAARQACTDLRLGGHA